MLKHVVGKAGRAFPQEVPTLTLRGGFGEWFVSDTTPHVDRCDQRRNDGSDCSPTRFAKTRYGPALVTHRGRDVLPGSSPSVSRSDDGAGTWGKGLSFAGRGS